MSRSRRPGVPAEIGITLVDAGAVLAATIQLQPSSSFLYDSSAQIIGFGEGFTHIASWQDVP
jgi:hypothetical protein